MVADCDTNLVYISSRLSALDGVLIGQLRKLLGPRLREINGTKDIWCRDYMPIEIAPGRFVQFKHDPNYLRNCPKWRTRDGAALLKLTNCIYSGLNIDGGNVVRWHYAVIMTDRIFAENRRSSRRALLEKLRQTLEVERLIIIPQEPHEEFGHADGIVRFVDGRTVLVNDYLAVDPDYGRVLDARLRLARLGLIKISYSPLLKKSRLGEQSAVGVHVNFLKIKGLIVCPVFGMKEDDQALRVLQQAFPRTPVKTIRCEKLAAEGGVLNCATWNVTSAAEFSIARDK